MTENTVFRGKPPAGLGVKIQPTEIKVCMEQLKHAYRDVTDEEIKELKAKAIGCIVT